MWFEALFELKVNVEESEIIQVGGVDNIQALGSALGCQVGSLPSSYLGLSYLPLSLTKENLFAISLTL